MSAEPIPDCPYQGLEPFSENDRAYFFGRDIDTQRIGANLVTSPLTIFYGASGVGKTSVLLAGVLPFVHKQPDVTAIVFRKWQGSAFERDLKSEVANAVAAKSDKTLNIEQALDRCLDDAARLTGGTIAVVFDQFEEYMLYHAPSSPEGRSFDTAFARAVNRSDADVNFLIGIREDALARLDRFRQYIPDLLSNRQQLVHLDEHGAEKAIRGPLEHYNEVVRARGRPELAIDIEDSLVAELIRQVRIGGVSFGGTGRVGDASVVRVETPFLQMVLMKLWEAERKAKSSRMREKTLHDLGDAKKLVLDHVDGVMKSLSDAERAAAATVFDRLVTPSRSKIAYAQSDLEAFAGAHADAVPSLVKRLSDPHVRILREVAATDGQAVRYEIFHDVLSEAVLAWRAKHLRDVEEAEGKRRRIGCTVMLVVFLSIVFGIGWYLHRQNEQRAELEKRALDAQAKLLQAMADRATSAGSAGAALGDLALLNSALQTYRELEDTAGQARILGQIGALKAGKQEYRDAIDAYKNAASLVPEGAAKTELLARIDAATGDSQAAAGDYSNAAMSYRKAADRFRSIGDDAQQAQLLTSAAVALQNVGELDVAEKVWTDALEIQKRRKDIEGQSKSLAGLESIEKQRKIRQMPVVTETAPPDRPAPEPCTFESFNGYWAEISRGRTRESTFIWRFEVVRGKGDVSMHVERIDGSVSGDFVFDRHETVFAGTLQWVNGEVRKNVIINPPSEQQNCGRIVTNQPYYFVRTKPPAATAY